MFSLQSARPPWVIVTELCKGVGPSITRQAFALTMLYFFPDIATWLPKAIGW